jgi:hypothetical protein
MIGKALAAIAGIALVTSAPADAACTLADAAGTWAAYSAGTTNGVYYWFRCTFTFDTAGKITAGACVESNGAASAVTGSVHLAVPVYCAFTSTLDFTKFNLTATIDKATLSLDKQSVIGVGSILKSKFTFNMMKIK